MPCAVSEARNKSPKQGALKSGLLLFRKRCQSTPLEAPGRGFAFKLIQRIWRPKKTGFHLVPKDNYKNQVIQNFLFWKNGGSKISKNMYVDM